MIFSNPRRQLDAKLQGGVAQEAQAASDPFVSPLHAERERRPPWPMPYASAGQSMPFFRSSA
jgi:hypothetical protein